MTFRLNKVIKGKSETYVKKILKREYKIQRIDGLHLNNKLRHLRRFFDRIKKDNILIGKARSIDSNLDFFKDKFIYPLENYIYNWCLW